MDNTLIIFIAGDNGTSAEGGFVGMYNEMNYFNGVEEKEALMKSEAQFVTSLKGLLIVLALLSSIFPNYSNTDYFLYIADSNNNKIYVGNASNPDVSTYGTIDVGDYPWQIEVHPSGKYVYVPNYQDDILSIIDTVDDTVIKTVVVGVDKRSGSFMGFAPHF